MHYNFSVGQKIACIDDRYSNEATMQHFKQWIERDKTYTVRQVRPHGAEGGILLEEIKNPPCYFPQFGGNLEPAFNPRRFVAVEEFYNEEEETQTKEKELVIQEESLEINEQNIQK